MTKKEEKLSDKPRNPFITTPEHPIIKLKQEPSEKPQEPVHIKISDKNLRLLQWFCIIGLLLVTAYTLLICNDNFYSLMGNPNFFYIVMGATFIAVGWGALMNKTRFVRFDVFTAPITIKPEHKPIATFEFFNVVSTMLATAFVTMILIQVFVADSTGLVMVYYNHFNEMAFEKILFSIIGVMIFINTFFVVKKWRTTK